MHLKIEERIQELAAALESSAQQHNALVGRMAEAKLLLDTVLGVSHPKVVDAIDKIVPIIEGEIVSG